MTLSANLGFPRIGKRREIKRATETAENFRCGLKTRGYDETVPSLKNMVESARIIRQNL